MCLSHLQSKMLKEKQGENEVDCYFTLGPEQSLPSDFEALLQISEYKSQYLRFLMKE